MNSYNVTNNTIIEMRKLRMIIKDKIIKMLMETVMTGLFAASPY
jgi:uncharacterized protein YdcH (DUF465 family)